MYDQLVWNRNFGQVNPKDPTRLVLPHMFDRAPLRLEEPRNIHQGGHLVDYPPRLPTICCLSGSRSCSFHKPSQSRCSNDNHVNKHVTQRDPRKRGGEENLLENDLVDALAAPCRIYGDTLSITAVPTTITETKPAEGRERAEVVVENEPPSFSDREEEKATVLLGNISDRSCSSHNMEQNIGSSY